VTGILHWTKRHERPLLWGAWALVLFAAALLRFTHLDWDGLYQLHPDERAILFRAEHLSLPTSLGEVFDPARSPLNPLRADDGEISGYAYGHLPLYLHALAYHVSVLVWPLGDTSAFDRLTLAGRVLSGLYDTLTVLFVGLSAARVLDRRAGLLVSALAAVAVIHIQNAHFATVDSALTLASTVCLYGLLIIQTGGGRLGALLVGISFGAAVGCKASGMALLIPGLVTFLRVSRPVNEASWQLRLVGPRHAMRITITGALLTFVLTNPYALLDAGAYFNAVSTQAAMMAGRVNWPFLEQYTGTLPVLYAVEQQLWWGLGLPMTVVLFGGLVWSIWRAPRQEHPGLNTVIVWAVGALIIFGSGAAKFPRYLLPGIPPLLVLGGLALSQLKRLRLAAVAIVVIPSALYALSFMRMYSTTHPWVAASEWIYEHIEDGAVLVVEQYDADIPLPREAGNAEVAIHAGYDIRTINSFADEPEQWLDHALETVAKADYIILPSNQVYASVARPGTQHGAAQAFYEALFSGRLGYEPAAIFCRYPHLAGIALIDDPFARTTLRPAQAFQPPAPGVHLGFADQSFTLYDHPYVLILCNERRVDCISLHRSTGLAAIMR